MDSQNNPVHATRLRGRSRSPLAWLLPLLLVALVAGAAYWMMNRERLGGPDAGAAIGTSGRGDETGSLGSLQPGSDVHISRTKINEVVGDRTFWVGDGNARALVVIPEDSQGANSKETRERFTRGQEVTIRGRVAESGDEPQGLGAEDRQAVREARGRVIVARTVRAVSQSSAQ